MQPDQIPVLDIAVPPSPLDGVTVELSTDEVGIVESILAAKGQLAEVVPDDMDGDKLWDTLSACCKSLAVYRRSISVIKPLLGKLLQTIQSRPEIYRSRGYSTFDAFMTHGVRDILGVPRSEAYAAKRLVEKFPSLTIEDYKACSYSKIMEISKYTDETQASANQWIKAAQTHTLDELKDLAANNGIMSRDDGDLCNLTLIMPRSIKKHWTEFCSDPQIQSLCGTDDPGKIFELVLAESEAEFRYRANIKDLNQ